MNSVNLVGRLIRDPELRYLPGNGMANCTFTIAVDKGLSKEKKQEAESKNQQTADFIRIVTWGKTAENAGNNLVKGRQVAVGGRIQTGSYEKNGQKVYTTDVVAGMVEYLGAPGGTGTTDKSQNNSSFDDDGFPFGGGYVPSFGDDDDIPF